MENDEILDGARAIANLESDDPLLRRDAARALGEARIRSAVPALIRALERPLAEGIGADHPEHTSRAAAAVALGRIGDPRATEPLLRACADPFNLGSAASTALGRLDPPPVDALVEAAEDADPWRRARAVSALGEIGDRGSFDVIASRLFDPSDVVKRAAASACEKLRDPRAVAPLLLVLEDPSNSSFVRGYAAMALGALKDPSSLDALTRALDEDDSLVRRAAARAVCRIGAPDSLTRLREIAESDPDRSVRDVVLRYLSPRPGQRRH